jgi:hypothetical protein
MAALSIIPQGSSAEWLLAIKNADGTPFDPTPTLGYAVFLFDKNGKLFKKYSSNDLEGFIATLEISSGKVRMLWEGSQTKDFPAGEIYFQYMHQVENEDFETDAKFTAKSLKTRLCIIEETDSKYINTVI